MGSMAPTSMAIPPTVNRMRDQSLRALISGKSPTAYIRLIHRRLFHLPLCAGHESDSMGILRPAKSKPTRTLEVFVRKRSVRTALPRRHVMSWYRSTLRPFRLQQQR